MAEEPDKLRPVTENDVPIIVGGEELKPLPVLVDGRVARIFVGRSLGWRSDKIVILFDEPHPDWPDGFGTKHYRFIEPGLMMWGYDGDRMVITFRD